MAVKPITGMLRRGIVLDLTVALGLGTTAGYAWWYALFSAVIANFESHTFLKGYHVPAVRHRDVFYQKIEDERVAALGQNK
ncbi:hypothetical protein V2W45_1459833 [Cenococcum geophilum]